MPSPGWDETRAREVIHRHDKREGALLPILHDLQAEFGFIPQPAVPLVADELNLTRAEVHGVVTFYHDFREQPAGRHVLKLCRAEACQSMGAEAIANEVLKRFATDWEATTPDGMLTVEATYCLGICACGPAALLDGHPIGRLNGEAIDEIAREVRGR